MSELPEQRGPFVITEAAKHELEAAAQAHGLWRFGVRVRFSGRDASSGFDLSFDELPEQGDQILRSEGLRLFVSEDVLAKVVGTVVIDHHGRGFVFRKGKA